MRYFLELFSSPKQHRTSKVDQSPVSHPAASEKSKITIANTKCKLTISDKLSYEGNDEVFLYFRILEKVSEEEELYRYECHAREPITKVDTMMISVNTRKMIPYETTLNAPRRFPFFPFAIPQQRNVEYGPGMIQNDHEDDFVSPYHVFLWLSEDISKEDLIVAYTDKATQDLHANMIIKLPLITPPKIASPSGFGRASFSRPSKRILLPRIHLSGDLEP